MDRPPLPPFSAETAAQKARMAEDAWNTRDPAKVALAYTLDSRWRNRAEFIQGRDAIHKDSDKRFQARFHDLSIRPQIVRTLNDSIWEAGEWTMKIGDQSVRGYFAMTLVREGNGFKIRDDTFNIAPPALAGPQPATK